MRADCTSLSPLILLSTNLTHYFLADAPSLPLPFSSSWLLRAELLMAGAELNEKSEQSSDGVMSMAENRGGSDLYQTADQIDY